MTSLTVDFIGAVASIIGLVILPVLFVLMRAMIKWSRVETKLDHVIERLNTIVQDKDKVHTEIVDQMREDRSATNARLQWLERNLWKKERDS